MLTIFQAIHCFPPDVDHENHFKQRTNSNSRDTIHTIHYPPPRFLPIPSIPVFTFSLRRITVLFAASPPRSDRNPRSFVHLFPRRCGIINGIYDFLRANVAAAAIRERAGVLRVICFRIVLRRWWMAVREKKRRRTCDWNVLHVCAEDNANWKWWNYDLGLFVSFWLLHLT